MLTIQREVRMVKDGEEWHGLQTTSLKNLGFTFQENHDANLKATGQQIAQVNQKLALKVVKCKALRYSPISTTVLNTQGT